MTIAKPRAVLAAWTTADELRFVTGLVKRSALAGYIAAATKRSDWGAVDVSVVVEAAQRRLDWLKKGAA